MTDFWREMDKGVKCIKLIEQFMMEEENLMRHLTERGKPTNHCEFKIARMKYALGEISIEPDYRTYFPTKKED